MIYIKLVLTAIFWGGTFVAGRILSPAVEPFSAAFVRFSIASLCLYGLMRNSEDGFQPITRGQILPVILLGLTGVVAYNAFFFTGLHYVTAGRASVIIANNPIFIILFSALFFRERLTWINLIGVLLSVSGAVIAISRGDLQGVLKGSLGWGEFYIFCCVMSWVAFSLIGKRVLHNLSPLAAIGYSAFVGTAALLPAALWEGLYHQIPAYTAGDWTGLAYLGLFGTVAGFVWYYDGIDAIGPSKASLFINLVPISAILLAFLILEEPLSPSLVAGAFLVVTGIYISTQLAPVRRPSPYKSD